MNPNQNNISVWIYEIVPSAGTERKVFIRDNLLSKWACLDVLRAGTDERPLTHWAEVHFEGVSVTDGFSRLTYGKTPLLLSLFEQILLFLHKIFGYW